MGNLRHLTTSAILGGVWLLYLVNSVSGQNSGEWRFNPYTTDQWFKQKVDHYDSSNVQHWPQRYMTSYRYYRLGGPIFLFLSGPGPELTLRDIESGAVAGYAEEQGAFVIGLEHRFYGKSKPTSDLSTDNLRYLTIPQTLEDIAAFIRAWKTRDDFRDTKWVLFGASYLGSVTAWFAQKHPELLDAFVASSAPLELRYEIPEFLENVGFIINRTDPKCYDVVSAGFKCLTDIFNEQGCENYNLQDVKTKFDLCADLDPTRPLDASGAIAELFSTINGVVMYHDPDPKSFPDTNLNRFCRHVSSEEHGKTPLEKIADKVREINKHRGTGCAEFRFETTVEFLREKEWDSSAAVEGYRQLQWQLCNELGWTVAAANISQPFGNYLSPFLHGEICQKLFGLSETEMRLKVLKSNTDLGGKNITTKCGIFVNGDMDPWHSYSISSALEAGKCNRAVLIEGGSHARDIEDFTNTPSYPPSVRQAQAKIAHYLDTWLKTGRCCDEDYISRSARSSSDYYSPLNSDLMRTPNVQIKHRSYPSDYNERMIASPTAVPYQLSTTDVLSVSPRIPVTVEHDAASINSDNYGDNVYRDPRNAELRRYRIVKMLRHRHPFSPPSDAEKAPSMEQFEADFPQHSIRIEGRVEKVFKNGTKVNPTQVPSSRPDDEQLEMFSKGRKVLTQTAMPNLAVGPTPRSEMGKGGDDVSDNDKQYRYVVKQVFRDVVDGRESPVETKREAEALSDSKLAPQNGNGNDKKMDQNAKADDDEEESGEENASEKSSTEEHEQVSAEEPSESKKAKRESSEETKNSRNKSSDDDIDEDSMSTSESVEQTAATKPASKDGRTTEKPKEVAEKKSESSKKDSKADERDDDDDDDDYDDDDYYDDDYDDDDADDDDDKSNEIRGRKKTSKAPPTKTPPSSSTRSTNSSKISNSEFSSGEDSKPRRLREKISEKIMSSSEYVKGDQKSKEKSKIGKTRGGKLGSDRDEDSLEEDSDNSKSSLSEEDYNYSLEPSGSDPQHIYKKSSKKQLEQLAKPAQEDPHTVINVEISGSYPKRNQRQKKRAKPTTSTTTTAMPSVEEVDSDSSDSSLEILPTHKPKRKSHRKRKPRPSTTSEPSTSTTTSTTEVTTSPSEEEERRTNSYVAWNRDKKLGRYEERQPAIPVQQESPNVVNLGEDDDGSLNTKENHEEGNNALAGKKNNDVIYIVIGDIPKETDSENAVDDQPSGDALFRFIQKLVNRHTPCCVEPRPPNGAGIPESPSRPEIPESPSRPGIPESPSRPGIPESPSRPGQYPESPSGQYPESPSRSGQYPESPSRPGQYPESPSRPGQYPESSSRPGQYPESPARPGQGKFPQSPPRPGQGRFPDSAPRPGQVHFPESVPLPSGEIDFPESAQPPSGNSEYPESASPPLQMNYGFDGPTGKYLLIRPVQVVALGRDHVVHAHDLKNESLVDFITMETPTRPSPYSSVHQRYRSYPNSQNIKRQYGEGYSFKSPSHRDHFEKLLSVDDQVRDSDRGDGGSSYRQSHRRLDQIPDPTWRSIRGLSQFGPVISNPTSGLLSLSAADTQWVNDGIPFLPRNRRH